MLLQQLTNGPPEFYKPNVSPTKITKFMGMGDGQVVMRSTDFTDTEVEKIC